MNSALVHEQTSTETLRSVCAKLPESEFKDLGKHCVEHNLTMQAAATEAIRRYLAARPTA